MNKQIYVQKVQLNRLNKSGEEMEMHVCVTKEVNGFAIFKGEGQNGRTYVDFKLHEFIVGTYSTKRAQAIENAVDLVRAIEVAERIKK
jgi:hypothetical protein